MTLDVTKLDGIFWNQNGQTALSGMPLAMIRQLDRLFLGWAGERRAVEYHFPLFIDARELDKLDYFRSFPHLVTFPVTLDSTAEHLKEFSRQAGLDETGAVRLGKCSPVHEVLTPAACYHFYVLFQGTSLESARILTTVATCFRREAYYRPLERQWNFTMREIVCIGTAEEVKEFLSAYRSRLERFFSEVDLPIAWQNATDPFFDPSRNPKFIAQKLEPVKTEMVSGGELAIGSINFHRNFFGETFEILREGEPAFSGCVAFGVERWLFALLSRFGPDSLRILESFLA
jgi:seryl-tRNA synthetase